MNTLNVASYSDSENFQKITRKNGKKNNRKIEKPHKLQRKRARRQKEQARS